MNSTRLQKIIFVLTILFFRCAAQVPPAIEWANAGGSAYGDWGSAVVADSMGNVYTTGVFQDVVDFDPSPAVYTLSANGYDAYLAKYGPAGNLIWATVIGGWGGDRATAIGLDHFGHVYVGGDFAGGCYFPSVAGPTYSVSSLGINDVFVARYSANGTCTWAKSFGGTSVELLNSLGVDGQGSVYMTGYITGTVDFDPSAGAYTLSAVADAAYVSKLDSSGNFAWAYLIDGTGYEQASAIAVNAAGDVCVTGHFSSATFPGADTVDFDFGPGTFKLASANSMGSMACFIAKYTASGGFSWAGALISSANIKTYGVDLDAQGNAVVTGFFFAATDFDFGPATNSLAPVSAIQADAFLAKYDATGNYLWANACAENSASNAERGISVKLDAWGSVYVTGSYSGTVDLDPSASVASFTSAGNADIFLAKYSAAGAYAWAKTINSGGNESPAMISVHDSTNIWVTGKYEGSINFNGPSPGSYSRTANGFTDFFTVKYTTCNIPSFPVITASGSNTICSAGSTLTLSLSSATLNSAALWQWYSGTCGGTYLGTGTQVAVSPSVTTSYFVRGEGGCEIMPCTDLTVYVGTAPTLSVSASASLVCAFTTLSLTATGANSFLWSTGGTLPTVTVSPVTNTVYTVSGLALNGCSSTAVQTVSVYPLSPLAAAASSTAICAGQSATLSASGAVSYTWLPAGLSATAIAVSPPATVNYTLLGTDSFGCENNVVKNIIVMPLPSVSIVSTGTVCQGDSLILSSSGAVTYTWSTGAVNSTVHVAPATNATYTLFGAGATGCVNTAVKTVTVHTLPNITILGNDTICATDNLVLLATGALSYTWSNNLSVNTITVIPPASGIYSVTGTNINNCRNSASLYVQVIPNPTVFIGASSTSICSGDSLYLFAFGGNSYNWQPGNFGGNTVRLAPLANTVYSLTGAGNFGCSSSASISIGIKQLPVISIVSTKSLICPGESVVLTAQGASTYTWNNAVISPSLAVSPPATTIYSVVGMAANGCTNSVSFVEAVTLCTAMFKNGQGAIHVFPNPSRGELFIKFPVIPFNYTFELYDQQSRLIKTQKLQGLTNTIDLREFENGLYYLLIFENKQLQQRQKIILEH